MQNKKVLSTELDCKFQRFLKGFGMGQFDLCGFQAALVFIVLHCVFLQVAAQMGPCIFPPDFPSELSLSLQSYQNFGKEFKVPFAYVVTARSSREVIILANWAYKYNYRVRAMGSRHTWAPLTFTKRDCNSICPKIILVDTTKYFTSMQVNPTDPERPDLYSVTVGPGVKLQSLLEFLEAHDLGIYASPPVGAITVGGLIAIGAHGSGIPATWDQKSVGHTYGTWSNLIIELEIVVWDTDTNSYVLKRIHRSDKEAKAFLVSLGRTFVTLVTLRVGRNQNLRTQSHFYINADELFAHPHDVKETTRTVEKYTTTYGRTLFLIIMPKAEAFTWVVTIHNEPTKPQSSRSVTKPFNYIFQNIFPTAADPILRVVLRIRSSLWKFIGPILYKYLVIGTKAAFANDYWGPSKNHFLFVPKSVPQMKASSYTVLTSQENLQLVVHLIRSHFVRLARQLEIETEGKFYMAGEFNIRVGGVDDPKDVEIVGAEAPSLSNASPMSEYPDYQLIVWCEISSYDDNPHMYTFLTNLQEALYQDIHAKVGILRVEWPKAWAHTKAGGSWTNTTIKKHFARTFSTSSKLEEWNWAVKTLNSYDPHKIFSNDFLDDLLVSQ